MNCLHRERRDSALRLCLSAIVCAALTAPVSGQTIAFTKTQADAGQALYRESCQTCHGSTLANGQFAAPLKGEPFQDKWKAMTIGDLLTFILDKMPPDKPKSLTPEQAAAAAAFILLRNGLAAGNTALDASQAGVALPW